MSKRVATNITWHEGHVDQRIRQALLKQRGATVWLTGLSASGKSTLAFTLEHALIQEGQVAYVLDGDNIRHGLNYNLGFSAEDRAENIRRVAEVAKLFADAGLVVITAFISPYRCDRDNARTLHERTGVPFFEVFVDAPLAVCEQRDPKGLYVKARAGQIKQFTGIDDPYEPPLRADLVLRTDQLLPQEAALKILELLRQHGLIGQAARDGEAAAPGSGR